MASNDHGSSSLVPPDGFRVAGIDVIPWRTRAPIRTIYQDLAFRVTLIPEKRVVTGWYQFAVHFPPGSTVDMVAEFSFANGEDYRRRLPTTGGNRFAVQIRRDNALTGIRLILSGSDNILQPLALSFIRVHWASRLTMVASRLHHLVKRDGLAALGKIVQATVRTQLANREKQLARVLNSTPWPIMDPVGKIVTWLRRTGSFGGQSARMYHSWIQEFGVITPGLRKAMTERIAGLQSPPLISVIMPSYNIHPKWVSAAIESVRNQIYPYWQLCISDDASTIDELRPVLEAYRTADSRIRVFFREKNGHISANSNSALDLATGDYIALMDADDLLTEDALFWMAHEIALHPDVDLLFSDEDKIDAGGTRFEPFFKPAWNPALMLSQNAFSHLGVYRRQLVEEVGRFREGYEGAQDHDLVLRCAAKSTVERIRHIPRVLYHWRVLPKSTAAAALAKPYALEAGRLAISDALKEFGIAARVRLTLGSYYQVMYKVPRPRPLVSILVPTALSNKMTAKCLLTMLMKSTYDNYELVILANAKNLADAENNPDFAGILTDARVCKVSYESSKLNYSLINNLAAKSVRGEILCLIHDDVEVITDDWLERLVARITLDGVGAVGVMLYDPSDLVQHAGVILGIGGVAGHAFRKRRRGRSGNFGRGGLEQDYSCVTAACMVVRRDLFEKISGFDETLSVGFNDVDLCIKIRQTGARIIWTPTVEMYHHESSAFGSHNSPRCEAQFQRDVKKMRERWGDVLDADSCYNPNLSLAETAPFSLTKRPRLPTTQELIASLPTISISRTSQLPFRNDTSNPTQS